METYLDIIEDLSEYASSGKPFFPVNCRRVHVPRCPMCGSPIMNGECEYCGRRFFSDD